MMIILISAQGRARKVQQGYARENFLKKEYHFWGVLFG